MSTNNFTIVGSIAEPRMAYTQDGKAVCTLSVADQVSRKNDQGGYDNMTDTLWVKVTLWEGDAEAAGNALNKGDQVIITGRLANKQFQDKNTGQQLDGIVLMYPTVGKVIRGQRRQGQQQGYGAPPQQQGDPWATPAPQQGQRYADGTPAPAEDIPF